MPVDTGSGTMPRMLGMRDLPPMDLQALPAEAAAMITQLQQRLDAREQQLAQRDRELAQTQELLQRKERDLALREAKIEKITFELARLKRWKFAAKSEAMNAEQRRLFEETLAEDEASLREQLERLRREAAAAEGTNNKPKAPPRRPRREALPAHLRRVEHRHEPESTDCQETGCGRPMTRIGEDVSERLDIVPAEFFVHRHIYGKWACRCCQTLKQAPAVPEVIAGGIAASGLVAHTLISRFVDHLPYYRQESINARSGVHTPRSTLASLSGQAGCGAGAPVRGAQALRARLQGPARRRDAGGAARSGRGQDAPGLHVGVCAKLGTMPCPAWSTTSASDAARSTRWPSSVATTSQASDDGQGRC